MTPIDHQQAAVLAGAEALWKADPTCFGVPAPKTRAEWADETTGYTEDSRAVITAATPHLRAAWEQELARAVKRLPWNGVTHGGTMVPLDAVLALLEGGGEPFSAHDEKGHDQQKCCCLEKRWTGLCGHDQEGGGE